MDVNRGLVKVVKGIKTFATENAKEIKIMQFKLGSKLTIQRLAVNAFKTTYSVNKYGLASEIFRPVVFAPNQHNEIQSIKARVLCPTPPVDRAAMTAFSRWCDVNKKQIFPRTFGRKIKPLPFEEYLKGSGASASVKRILLKTRQDLAKQGIDEYSFLSKEQLYQWTYRKSFVKVEGNLYRAGPNLKDKAPRLIQGAQPEFVCLVGPWIAALQKRIKRDWNINNFITYTSSISNLKLGNKLVDFGGKLGEDDVGKWDASFGEELCKHELKMAKNWFNAPPAVWMLMKANIKTHGKTLTGLKYKVKGTRKSGDPYTSLFNSVENALTHVWMLCNHNNWSWRQAKTNIVMFVQGDDNAMAICNGTYPDVKNIMLQLGFESQFIFRRSYVELEFCSMRVYKVKEGHSFGPKPGRIFSKTGYYVNPPLGVSRESLVKGTMLGLVNSCHHIPPLMSYIRTQLRMCGDAVPYYTRLEDWKTVGAKCTATLETYTNLNYHYSWTPLLQQILDEELDRMTSLDNQFDNTIIKFMCNVDTGAPKL
jgi:hypothetical protein